MARYVILSPRGDPDPGTRWHDPTPRVVAVDSEDATAWHGRPVVNPACPSLDWPRYAWQDLAPTMTQAEYAAAIHAALYPEIVR